MTEVFKKNHCCGCGVCSLICPKSAIEMVTDLDGFVYPSIDISKCIDCCLCKKKCAYNNEKIYSYPKRVYAAMIGDKSQLLNSASGGVFYILAKKFIENGGVVYGCAWNVDENGLQASHIRVDELNSLHKLQGSKYVQSDTIPSYAKVLSDLKSGLKVLYSGTPCQIASIQDYCGENYNENLFTVDLICHGVPNNELFNSYIKYEEEKLHGNIIDYKFRDKSLGWGLHGKIKYKKRGKYKYKHVNPNLDAYYRFFLDSDIYRENCYECKYSCEERTGDITLGDYWGIQNVHPEYMVYNGGAFDESLGVSCLLVNNSKANQLIDLISRYVILKDSTFENVSKENLQLKMPSKKSMIREEILNIYKCEGYSGLTKWYKKQNKKKYYIAKIWGVVPLEIKKYIKKYVSRKI